MLEILDLCYLITAPQYHYLLITNLLTKKNTIVSVTLVDLLNLVVLMVCCYLMFHLKNVSNHVGNLALSRAIGDFEFKNNVNLPAEEQIVTCNPDIIVREFTEGDDFFVIACDGIYDFM
jgi:hypothetical protein